jgi:hypothetical protein
MSQISPVPDNFWHQVLIDMNTSRELMRVRDYAGALDIASNAKERIEREGQWPTELGRPELQACFALAALIIELQKLAAAASPINDLSRNLRNEASIKTTSVGIARPRK